MKYQPGETAHLGDQVLIENGKTTAVVHAVAETKEQLEFWGLNEETLILEAAPFGLVSWKPNDPTDPVIFVARKDS